MAIDKILTRLEDAKRHVMGVLNDLDEASLPSGEKYYLAHRLDHICGDCDAAIEDLVDLDQWSRNAHTD